MLEQPILDRCFRALADPTRRAILERLSIGPATVSDVAQPFGISMAAVVQHLQVLEDSGLVRTDKFGRVRTCSLEPDGLAAVAGWIDARRTRAELNLDRLGEVLDEMHPPSRSKPGRKRP